MAAFPLSILALAAGVALLIKVKKDGLGMLYKALSWLVVLLALAFMFHLGRMAWRHHHDGMMMGGHGHGGHRMGCGMMMDGRCDMRDGKDSAGMMAGCHMKGDSVVMDKDVCEKAIGKEACEKMCKERGCCIMSKDECMKMCNMNGNQCCMSGGGGGCCSMHEGCCGGMSMGGSCCGGGGNMSSCCSSGGGMSMEKCSGDKAEPKACCKK